MFKTQMYPNTPRISDKGDFVELTEKIDGSNLTFINKPDDLYIAQRQWVFSLSEVKTDPETKRKLYHELYTWLIDEGHGDWLRENLCEGSAICGEWIGMKGHGNLLKYEGVFPQDFMMFAKANMRDEWKLLNLNYDHRSFIYPFKGQEIPEWIGVVPVVADIYEVPTKEVLDRIHEEYETKVGRKVEGFVVNCKNTITKYVRYKNGKKVEYSQKDHKSVA